MTDQTESDGLDHTRNGVPEGRLLHASPVLPARGESEHAELLADLDFYDEDHWRNVMRQYPGAQAAIRKAAAAIRALEAKVRESRELIADLRAERSTFDCRYAGQYWEASGSHCPLDRPCMRCRLERAEEELTLAKEHEAQAVANVARLSSDLAKAREDGNELMHSLSSAWFYGAWRAETFNERRMQSILERNGYWPTTEAALIGQREAIDASRRAGGEG